MSALQLKESNSIERSIGRKANITDLEETRSFNTFLNHSNHINLENISQGESTVTRNGSNNYQQTINLSHAKKSQSILLDTVSSNYYLVSAGGVVGLLHEARKYWESQGTGLVSPAEGDVMGIVFDVYKTGNCPTLKRMDADSTGGTVPELWPNTSDQLETGTYMAALPRWPSDSFFADQIRDVLVPWATLLDSFNMPANNVDTWAGFQLGWSAGLDGCSGNAVIFNFRWVVYGDPSEVPDESVLNSGNVDGCPTITYEPSQPIVVKPINARTGGYDYSTVDLSIPTTAGNIEFRRTYSSNATDIYTNTLGVGWTHSLDTRLIFSDTYNGNRALSNLKPIQETYIIFMTTETVHTKHFRGYALHFMKLPRCQ